MPASERERADARLEDALRESGARDPREFYRDRLKDLKERDPTSYQEAVRYFEETLIPAIATGDAPPLPAWTRYGEVLAELCAPGRTIAVDPTGRAQAYEGKATGDALVLHLPHERRGRALLVGLPGTLTDAQRATYDWLVAGRHQLRAPE